MGEVLSLYAYRNSGRRVEITGDQLEGRIRVQKQREEAIPSDNLPARVLTEEAQADRDDFEAKYGSGNCSCHIRPPCGSCTHPGNPRNQEEDDSCWEDV